MAFPWRANGGPLLDVYWDSIWRSETEEDFREEVERLKAGQEYLSNTSFRNWVDKYWLAESKCCVSCFISLPIRVTTTNGLEAHNKVLKEKYLRKNDLKNLSSMLAVLIDQFILVSLNRYKEKNYNCHSDSSKI